MKKKLFSLLVSFTIGIAIFATNMYVRMDDGKIITFDTGKINEVFFGEDTDILPSDTIPSDTSSVIPTPADTALVDSLSNTLTYKVTSDSTASVIGCYDKSKISGDIVIPESIEIEGEVYSVTRIESGAFSGAEKIKSVEIPQSVTYIEECAFVKCVGLERVNIPSKVKAIEAYTFEGCVSLDSIFLPFNVSRIGGRAFENCVNLKIVVDNWEENVEYGMYGFLNVASVVYLRENPIDSLTVVRLEDVRSIDFGKLSDTTVAVYGSNIGSDSVFIPGKVLIDHELYTVTQIGESGFVAHENLTSITIPSTLERISNSAFHGCTKLTNLTIPSSVVEIGRGAFYDCTNLDLVIENSKDSIKYDKEYSFFGCKSVTFTKDTSAVAPAPVD